MLRVASSLAASGSIHYDRVFKISSTPEGKAATLSVGSLWPVLYTHFTQVQPGTHVDEHVLVK
jgi:hypothetical protein